MSDIDITQIIFASNFAGIGNNENASFSVSVPSQSLAANASVVYTASTPMSNEGSISEVQVQYKGISDTWWLVDGLNSYTDPAFAYTLTTTAYFTNDTLYVRNFFLELLGVGTTLPAITINCRGFLYNAPF